MIWITGASMGIGAALCRQYAKEGAIVAATARSVSLLEQLANQVDGTGAIIPYPADVTDALSMRQVLDQILKDYGRLDSVIFNAGAHKPERGLDISYETVRDLFELNVFSVLRSLLECLPYIQKQGGQMAIVASVAGYRGLPNAAAYCATKAALISFAESLRPACEQVGVKLQVICPGFVKTPLTDKNDFPMPFLISAEKAAQIIISGLKSRRFEIVFPWQMAIVMKILRLMPYGLFLPLMRQAHRAQKS